MASASWAGTPSAVSATTAAASNVPMFAGADGIDVPRLATAATSIAAEILMSMSSDCAANQNVAATKTQVAALRTYAMPSWPQPPPVVPSPKCES